MNWSIIDLKVGDYIKCKSESERKEFADFLFTYGYIVKRDSLKVKNEYDGYWLKVIAKWFDTENFK